jgi:hypothetical protein
MRGSTNQLLLKDLVLFSQHVERVANTLTLTRAVSLTLASASGIHLGVNRISKLTVLLVQQSLTLVCLCHFGNVCSGLLDGFGGRRQPLGKLLLGARDSHGNVDRPLGRSSVLEHRQLGCVPIELGCKQRVFIDVRRCVLRVMRVRARAVSCVSCVCVSAVLCCGCRECVVGAATKTTHLIAVNLLSPSAKFVGQHHWHKSQ